MIKQTQANIITNKKISRSSFFLELNAPAIVRALKPGHFLHLRIGSGFDPLLRRPLSVNRILRKRNNQVNIGIIYKVVGKGTRILSAMKPGLSVDILGPLGNGFNLRCGLNKTQPILLVSGGIGIAPLLYLAQSLKKTQKCKNRINIFMGMDTKKELVCLDEFKRLKIATKISTDDGTCGYKGYVSHLVDRFLKNDKKSNSKPYIYACGPLAMVKALTKMAQKYNLQGQVSLDEMMGCGIGACLGCVVKTKDFKNRIRYKRICKDGPVFDLNEIVWED
ncbi:MAG: dihydroorotate dehydrogenase electron transfer subunit [Candidatus Omnitrophota bacterium]